MRDLSAGSWERSLMVGNKRVLTRTLRSQVQSQGLVHFTNRYCITEDFSPNDDEIELYNLVSEYLRRPVLASTLSPKEI